MRLHGAVGLVAMRRLCDESPRAEARSAGCYRFAGSRQDGVAGAAPGGLLAGMDSATKPSNSANHSVARRIRSVATTAVRKGTPSSLSNTIIVVSLLPRPPGIRLVAPASFDSA